MINHIEAAVPKMFSSPEEANPEEKALSDNAKINQTVSKNKVINKFGNKKWGNLTIGCRKLIIETALRNKLGQRQSQTPISSAFGSVLYQKIQHDLS